MANITEKNFNLIDILKGPPKEPFSIDLSINTGVGDVDISILYAKIKDIFTKGLILQSGDDNKTSIDIKDINPTHIDIMKRHMLSMGIDIKLKQYTPGTKDCLFKELLYDIQNTPNLNIKVVTDWNTNLIENLNISMQITNGNLKPLVVYNSAIKKHFEANHFLKLVKPSVLHDYAIFVKNTNEDYVNVVFFDYAKRGGYKKIHQSLADNIRR